jgi:hypothetical protein
MTGAAGGAAGRGGAADQVGGAGYAALFATGAGGTAGQAEAGAAGGGTGQANTNPGAGSSGTAGQGTTSPGSGTGQGNTKPGGGGTGQGNTNPGGQTGGTQAGGGTSATGTPAALSGVASTGLPRNFRESPYGDIEVRRALNITADQLGRLGDADTRLRLGLKESLRDLDRLSEGARAVKSDELLLRYNSDFMRAAAQILDADQMARYRQISQLSEGLRVFTDPDVAKALHLSDEQRDKLKALRERTDGQLDKLASKAGRDVDAVQQKAAELRTDGMRQAGRVLSDEQRQGFAKLMGIKMAAAGKPAGDGTSERR